MSTPIALEYRVRTGARPDHERLSTPVHDKAEALEMFLEHLHYLLTEQKATLTEFRIDSERIDNLSLRVHFAEGFWLTLIERRIRH